MKRSHKSRGSTLHTKHTAGLRHRAALEVPSVDFFCLPERYQGVDVIAGMPLLGMSEECEFTLGAVLERNIPAKHLDVFGADSDVSQATVRETVGQHPPLVWLSQLLHVVALSFRPGWSRVFPRGPFAGLVPGYCSLPFYAVVHRENRGIHLNSIAPDAATMWPEGTCLVVG